MYQTVSRMHMHMHTLFYFKFLAKHFCARAFHKKKKKRIFYVTCMNTAHFVTYRLHMSTTEITIFLKAKVMMHPFRFQSWDYKERKKEQQQNKQARNDPDLFLFIKCSGMKKNCTEKLK